MKVRSVFKIAKKSLIANKSRSILTILGIVIGIMAIIIVVSVGGSAEMLVENEITSLGADIIWIEPGREPEGPTDFATTLLSNTLKVKDIEALEKKSNVPNLKAIAPAVIVPGSISYRGDTYRPTIMGWNVEFFGRIFNIYPEEGDYFDSLDIRNKEKVVVIGSEVKEELFGDSEAIGESIKIEGKNFRVVGVLPKKGQIMFFDISNIAIIPYTTAQSQILGTDFYNEVWVQVDDVSNVDRAILDIEDTLRLRHKITNPEKDDFYILTQQNLLEQVDSILRIVTTLILSVVAISLIVGGVGVMNIMLVSVAERTREIGLRKAIGATEKDISGQFLVEAVILTAIGGVIGILLGVIISFIASIVFTKFMGILWEFSFSIWAAALGLFVSSLVGLTFGYYPAKKAAEKNPIEALRYE